MRIYLDTCAVNRVVDDRTQQRVLREAEAVETILEIVRIKAVIWVASPGLRYEIGNNPFIEKRHRVMPLTSLAVFPHLHRMTLTQRVMELEAREYTTFDAYHVAASELLEADVFITTDDRLLRKIQRGVGQPKIQARNPIEWLKEATDAGFYSR